MKLFLAFTILATMISCGTSAQKKKTGESIQLLIGFVDSVHAMDPGNWVKKASAIPDSVFGSQQNLSVKLSGADYEKLISDAAKGKIDHKIFRKFAVGEKFEEGEIVDGYLDAEFFKFDGFEKFSLQVFNPGWEGDVYFFEKNNVIAKHHIFHRYGLDIESFRDENDETVIYYKQNFESGTGIWWWNYNFFKYQKGKLIPVLDVLQNSNLAGPTDNGRTLWFETFVEKTNPLTLKMVYQTGIPDVQGYEPVEILNDSTSVQYRWNSSSNEYEPDFSQSKLTKNEIISFYLDSDELLFIHAHYSLFMEILNGDDQKKKQAVAKYLKQVRKDLLGKSTLD